ncbi:origin recognition complex, subunit 4 [Terfezia boudieri ATCC MYA-4762]|uniref:Origin recognition complex subunit 4 n=1 Tax=Terfezia boudieri ATCC MYA-4762 TaxID=1051890 RepID=A0A3N4LM16_9PEZI|nr:origin recognition complex, subunit 4 [Terfezia boudieri ATCC MYA-4762]
MKPKSTYSGPVTELGVKLLKKHVLGKLSGRGKKRLVGFEEEYGHVYQLLEQTVVSGEGNSILIIGPRGVGKSTLVDTAIQTLQETHKGELLVVRLNGFLQTDDKLAIHEIWRQLGVEMALEDQGGQPKTSNFADTLTSILALLSHPDELSGGMEEEEDERGSRKTSLSVVFVLDEFDLFVTHPRQTLLYNLFDIAQARKAPIAVLGLTSRVDVVEGLEKRVKSRFSHRSVHLRLPNSIEQFWAVVRSGLEVDEDELGEIEGVCAEERGYWEKWNEKLEGLWEESKGFRMLVRRGYALTKDVKGFWANWCLFPISHLGTAAVAQSSTYTSLAGPENRLHILPALTELELSLLIAAARLDIISDTDTCNFNMAYDEYKSLAAKVKVQNSIGSTIAGGGVPGGGQGGKLWSREVAVGAWEGLGRWEVLVPVTVGGVQGGVGREGRMWRVDVGLGEIGRWAGQSGGVLGGVLGRWCREI